MAPTVERTRDELAAEGARLSARIDSAQLEVDALRLQFAAILKRMMDLDTKAYLAKSEQ